MISKKKLVYLLATVSALILFVLAIPFEAQIQESRLQSEAEVVRLFRVQGTWNTTVGMSQVLKPGNKIRVGTTAPALPLSDHKNEIGTWNGPGDDDLTFEKPKDGDKVIGHGHFIGGVRVLIDVWDESEDRWKSEGDNSANRRPSYDLVNRDVDFHVDPDNPHQYIEVYGNNTGTLPRHFTVGAGYRWTLIKGDAGGVFSVVVDGDTTGQLGHPGSFQYDLTNQGQHVTFVKAIGRYAVLD